MTQPFPFYSVVEVTTSMEGMVLGYLPLAVIAWLCWRPFYWAFGWAFLKLRMLLYGTKPYVEFYYPGEVSPKYRIALTFPICHRGNSGSISLRCWVLDPVTGAFRRYHSRNSDDSGYKTVVRNSSSGVDPDTSGFMLSIPLFLGRSLLTAGWEEQTSNNEMKFDSERKALGKNSGVMLPFAKDITVKVRYL